MTRSENKQQTDQITDQLIGEAVLSLLKRKGPVSTLALLAELRNMLAVESDPRRRETLPIIIAEVEATTLRNERPEKLSTGTHKENANTLLGNKQPQGKNKIH
ncbi:hypothetical protein [Scandinavium goeteborgense]|uniref:Uncharacterized protein n=1 Tax=Scandinavium goeteborgense TaxID=1851514 RepID=A0A4R6EEF6_SCAGO|nr:hypothetical protein [Scandinavium goeteborgense]TDN56614.1 hypothetical protein EC847_110119 [Scandinavium goeteborgense]